MRAELNRAIVILASGMLLGLAACHEVESVQPDPAAPGEVLTIQGSGFGASPAPLEGVTYDGEALEILTWSDDRIRVVAPAVPDGVHELRVVAARHVSPPIPHTIAGPLAILAPELAPGTENPLSADLRFQTSRPAGIAVTIDDPDGAWRVPTSGIRSNGVDHEVWLLGLEASERHDVRIQAVDGGDLATDGSLSYTPPALPADFPSFEVPVAMVDQMEPGLTLFAVNRTPVPLTLTPETFLMVVDAEGSPLWFRRLSDESIEHAERLRNGNLLFIHGSLVAGSVIEEIDPMGREVQRWRAPAPDTYHHHVLELPSGNLLALRTELRTIGGYPDGNGATTYDVVGDRIVELNRGGGELGSLSLFDVLSPYRYASANFHLPFWDMTYGVSTKDWTHGNGLAHDASDETVIVSMRHQDMVVKIAADPPRLVWAIGADVPSMAGDDDYPFLELVGPGRLPSHQHAPQLQPNGNVLVYDNSNATPELGSRAVEYDVDPSSGTVRQVWSWTDPSYDPPLFAALTGDADALPGGTVLVADTAAGGFFQNRAIRLAEVRKSDDLKVWELVVRANGEPWSYLGFDAERIPSLYPP